MKQSIHARRMAQQHRRHRYQTRLNLVSLMDIFTIIVFFLLMNSSDVEILQSDKSIVLPESVSEQKPETTLVVKINRDQLMLGNQLVTTVGEIANSETGTIVALEQALKLRALEMPAPVMEDGKRADRAITIMGDEAVPYELLKKVMSTCAAADFRRISLAVTRIESAMTAAEISSSSS